MTCEWKARALEADRDRLLLEAACGTQLDTINGLYDENDKLSEMLNASQEDYTRLRENLLPFVEKMERKFGPNSLVARGLRKVYEDEVE